MIGINSTEEEHITLCEYINEVNINDTTKMVKCVNYVLHKLFKSSSQYDIPNCSKIYCLHHKKLMFKNYKNKLIKDEKDKVKNEKMKLKQDEKNKIILEKQKLKEEKKMQSKNKKPDNYYGTTSLDNTTQENIIISDIQIKENSNDVGGCIVILKTGDKKGDNCGLHMHKNNMCKRHYNLHLKNQCFSIASSKENNDI